MTGTEAAAAEPAAGADTPAGASGGGSVPVPPAAVPGGGEAGAAAQAAAVNSPAPRAPGMKYTHYARAARLASYAAPPRSAWRRPPQGCCRRRSGRARSRACSSSRSIGPCIPPTRPPARCLSARCPRRRRPPASCMPPCGASMKRGHVHSSRGLPGQGPRRSHHEPADESRWRISDRRRVVSCC